MGYLGSIIRICKMRFAKQTNTFAPRLERVAQSSGTGAGRRYLTRDEVFSQSRLAFQLRRYHTWPVLQTQTIADHVGNLLRIYLCIFGAVPPEVSTHLVWHDAGELVSGDPPFPVKAKNPILKAECDRIEREAVAKMGGSLQKLSDALLIKVKVVELIEMMEFGLLECSLGNKYGEPIVVDTRNAATELCRKLSQQDAALVHKYVSSVKNL